MKKIILALITVIGFAFTVNAQKSVENQLSNEYALLHIYRPGSMVGAAVGYKLYLNDDEIFRVKNNSRITIKVTKAGRQMLWAKTESVVELPIDIELGKEYYIRCGLKMGAAVGRPNFEIVNGEEVKKEFSKTKSK